LTGETRKQRTERRLLAIEEHLEELDRRVNALNIWGGEHWHRDRSAKAEFTPGDAYNRLADISGGDNHA
jgi:hypothetical protein